MADILQVVLPAAIPGILTGGILALSRAIGETAPLIVVGIPMFIAFLPRTVFDTFTVLPMQIYNWTSRPQEEFQHVAAAGILVLLIVVNFHEFNRGLSYVINFKKDIKGGRYGMDMTLLKKDTPKTG